MYHISLYFYCHYIYKFLPSNCHLSPPYIRDGSIIILYNWIFVLEEISFLPNIYTYFKTVYKVCIPLQQIKATTLAKSSSFASNFHYVFYYVTMLNSFSGGATIFFPLFILVSTETFMRPLKIHQPCINVRYAHKLKTG